MASKSHTDEVYRTKRIPKNPIKFKLQLNEEQKLAKKVILDNTITLLAGSAGSGKTLLACNVALDGLFRKQYDKIIITRPTVSKEEIGFLPGDLREKMDPWVQPIYQNFFALYDKVKIEKCSTSHKGYRYKKKSDSGFKFLYAASRKIKNLAGVTLTTNHRNEIVEDLIEYYNTAIDKGISLVTSGSTLRSK